MALAADRPVFLYVESDGMVKLVERGGRLTFPLEGEFAGELDFRGEMDFPEGKVLFAVPRLHEWPRGWTFKDDVPAMTNVATVVHRAINASLVREVVGALAFHPDGDRVLLVKASRGFTKGMWNIPGGFVTYAEAPEDGMRREMLEETGIEVRLEKLLGVFTQKFGSPYYMRGHIFLARALTSELRLQKDEIAEAEWFPLLEAKRIVLNPFAHRAIAALESGNGMTLGAEAPSWLPAFDATRAVSTEDAMALALAISEASAASGGGPFGAVVVDRDGRVAGVGWNHVVATHDSTAHAEVVAIRGAERRLATHRLDGCALFTTCEPCIQCFGAIYWSGIVAVHACLGRADAEAIGFDEGPVSQALWDEALAKRGVRLHRDMGPRERAKRVLDEYRARGGVIY